MSAPIVDGTFNLRALPDAAGRPWLYRSATLDALTPRGVEQLRDQGVQLVVDLREGSERGSASQAHGLPVRHVPIYRSPQGPPQTGSITEVYRSILAERGAALAEAVTAVAQSPGPVLVHCTAGKDRTGLVVALALSAAGVPEDAVLDDYALSGPQVAEHRSEAVALTLAALALTTDEQRDATRLHLESPASVLAQALDRVAARGGAARYLLDHGLAAQDLALLRRRFWGPR